MQPRVVSYVNDDFTAWGKLKLRSPSQVETFTGFDVPGRQVHPLIGWDMPSAINAFINEDKRTLHRLGPQAWHDAAEWLPKAFHAGMSDRDVKRKAEELCSVAHFSLELTRANAWRGLRRGLRGHLEIHAKRNRQENDSSSWLSVTSQNSPEFYQQPIPRNAALNGVYRQDDPMAMPELFELFRPRGRPEELYMAALRVIAILVKGDVLPRAKRLFAGAHNAGVSHVELKGHAAALYEMVDVNKYRHTPAPRPAAQSDLLTAVCVGEDPAACIKVARAIAHEFGGAAAITYLADLPKIEAAERFQLLPIMLLVLVDTGTTIGELLANASGVVQTDLARFKDTPPPGVPGDQWWTDHNAVMGILQGPASAMPCKLLVQVDVMTFATMQIRFDMKSLLRAHRCVACTSLALEFERSADASREHATDLVEAARNGWVSEVARMLTHGDDVNGQHGRMSPLYGAAECNRVNIILSLSRDKQCDVNSGHKATGATPLYVAVENGHSDSIAALLAAGADVNLATFSGDSPVHVAVAKGLVDVAKQLVANGADMNASNKLGMTPFHLVLASRSVNTGMLRFLLATKADVNRHNLAGATPLQRIIQHPYESEGKKVMIAAALVDHGAEVNAVNRRSQVSPLHYAAGLGMLEMVRLLLNKGADVYALGNYYGSHIHALQIGENVQRDHIAKSPGDTKGAAIEAMVSQLQQAAEAALARARLPASRKRPTPLPGYDDADHKVVRQGSKHTDGRIKITVDKTTGVAPGQAGLSFVELPGKGQKITAVVKGAAAHATGKIAAKMVIMFVNGASVKNVSKEECAKLIRKSNPKVTLTLRPPKSKSQKKKQVAVPASGGTHTVRI
jgi:ankyrin repeat protein